MIVEAIFGWFFDALTWLLELMPDWAFPDISGELTAFFDLIGPHGRLFAWMNIYFPVREAVALLGVGLTLWLGTYAYKIVVYGLTKLHVLGGAGE